MLSLQNIKIRIKHLGLKFSVWYILLPPSFKLKAFFNCAESIINLISDMPTCEIRWFKNFLILNFTELMTLRVQCLMKQWYVLSLCDRSWRYFFYYCPPYIMFGREEKTCLLNVENLSSLVWPIKTLMVIVSKNCKFVEPYTFANTVFNSRINLL